MRTTSLRPFRLAASLVAAALACAAPAFADDATGPTPASTPAPAAVPAAAPAPVSPDAPPDAAPPPKGPPVRNNAVTLSPAHLQLKVIEITAERNLGNKISASGIVGYGGSGGATIFEIGAQAAYVLFGDFDDCVKVGVEGVYIGGSAAAGSISSSVTGFQAGPFLGFKTAADFGLTFEFDLGVDHYFISGEAKVGTTSVNTVNQSKNIPLVNLQLGWSF